MQLSNIHFNISLFSMVQILICIIPKIASYDSMDELALAPFEDNKHTKLIEFDNGYEQGIKSVKNLRSRHMNSKMVGKELSECRQAYKDVLSHHCLYPGMDEPCYGDEEEQNENGGSKLINITDKIHSIVSNCCRKSCPLNQLEKLCCRNKSCLKRCYGSKVEVSPDSLKNFDVLTTKSESS